MPPTFFVCNSTNLHLLSLWWDTRSKSQVHSNPNKVNCLQLNPYTPLRSTPRKYDYEYALRICGVYPMPSSVAYPPGRTDRQREACESVGPALTLNPGVGKGCLVAENELGLLSGCARNTGRGDGRDYYCGLLLTTG